MYTFYWQQCDYGSRFHILKGGKISLIVSAFIATTTLLQASPIGGVVTAGSATIAESGAVTTITQSTQKAAINWNNFSIAPSETVNFNQPNVSSITLNRVVGNEKSIIDGALTANGEVFILNSNGVLFSKNASINTAGLVATTMNLSDMDFMNGNYQFKGNSSDSVINQGTIHVFDKGYVALLGKEVRNEGIIRATLGKVELVGAKEVTLNLNGNSLVSLTVNKGLLDALVENKGAIYADGGEVYLTTAAVNELLKGVVNNTGLIEANSIDDITGKVELFAHGGEAKVSGKIKAEGGFVETSGDKVSIADSFRVTADTWLIDPTDFTVAASGGDTTGAAIAVNLATANVEIFSSTGSTAGSGNIYVNDAISWNSTKKLTLTAQNDIFINQAITATQGQLALYYGQGAIASGNSSNYHINTQINLSSGDNFLTKLGNDGGEITWSVINDITALQGISLSGHYALGSNIDASSTASWNSGAGFVPIGNSYPSFSGSFDGLGHTIDALTINLPGTDFVGLFGYIDGASVIKNIGLTNVNITGKSYSGGLVGFSYGTITNAYATGNVNGTDHLGGLIGMNRMGAITNVYATGNVNGTDHLGGLIGTNDSGSITNAYATGNVSGTDYLGGLVGTNDGGTITNAYATGNVSGANYLGGLVGANNNFVMMMFTRSGTITNTYATGNMIGIGTNIGGIVGQNNGIITASFWNTDKSGSTGIGSGDTSGAIGKTTAELQQFSTFDNAGWDIGVGTSINPSLSMDSAAHTWTMVSALHYTLSDISNIYKGTAYSLSDLWSASSLFGASYSSWIVGMDYTFLDNSGNVVTSYTNAGTYSNLHIDILRNGYTEATSGNTIGSLTIIKAPLTITANNASKTKDGIAYSGGNGVSYSGFVNHETAAVLGGALSYGGTAQGATTEGTYVIKPMRLSSGNYTLNYVDGVLMITLAPTVSTSREPNIAHIENGVAVRSPFFAETIQTLETPSNTTPPLEWVGLEVLQGVLHTASSGDTRVPLWSNSLIQLVNGGVHLPEGLDQQFFMVQR
ncbi:Heme/hemopexin-binding protein [Sulfurospirillum diekertiae]|uniref:Heme/hemopexin-binding protein n=1 Tax=Sulfurospirillum diekertiae TaxID=1854492 RepID=A0A290HTF7_9BACT|nr:filamentous hemagglutinin N-terminal domain-containing protein [Sulfurospirillum diekertiae]ATB68950.1 Heme/hemopexin-binding protein [Sulfurospirillum diekertiae]